MVDQGNTDLGLDVAAAADWVVVAISQLVCTLVATLGISVAASFLEAAAVDSSFLKVVASYLEAFLVATDLSIHCGQPSA